MVEASSRAPFEKAGIRIEKLEQFEELESAIARVFAPPAVERFLRLLRSKGVPIRDFDRILRERLLERADEKLATGGGALELYQALAVSDQAQMREFYLTVLEAVDQPLREKFNQLYRYY